MTTTNIPRPRGRWARGRRRSPDRILAGVLAAGAAVLLAWTVGMAFSIPPSEPRTVDWALLWCGFDAIEIAVMASAAWLVRRRDALAPMALSALATLMVADAWFDVMTARSGYLPAAVSMAAFLELPLAAVLTTAAVRLTRRRETD
ncbi:hypothetical protein DZF91_30465 [Actinomadura logoneensis]|uniref:Uncharacterized protein n=1 Tax=Actinomadura logoneensis TaxID=2293572 RepID=A0A372JD16_9ACTN|nr:hypothetical protein DZF91_30465 [Actinomadura logoneensis]